MKPIYFALLVAAFIAAFAYGYAHAADDEYCYVGFGLGKNQSLTGSYQPWDDGGGTGTTLYVGCAWTMDPDRNWWYGMAYRHYSQIDVGPPWDREGESTLDHIGLWLEYRIY